MRSLFVMSFLCVAGAASAEPAVHVRVRALPSGGAVVRETSRGGLVHKTYITASADGVRKPREYHLAINETLVDPSAGTVAHKRLRMEDGGFNVARWTTSHRVSPESPAAP